MAEPKRLRVDAAAVRALAHPLRMRIMAALRAGPSTATALARELGESTGATSYHLRALARFGFVEEVEGHGTRRERWWRRPEGFRWVVGERTVEARAAGMSTYAAILAGDEQALRAFVESEDALADDWRDAATIGGWNVTATPEDVNELADVVATFLDRISRNASDAASTKPVRVSVRILPLSE